MSGRASDFRYYFLIVIPSEAEGSAVLAETVCGGQETRPDLRSRLIISRFTPYFKNSNLEGKL
jgi:hypothetical protein